MLSINFPKMKPQSEKNLSWMIGIGVLFPLFFQLSKGVYRDSQPIIDSQGVLLTLPLPISILACFLVSICWLNNLHKARLSLIFVAGTILASFLSLWLGGDGMTAPQRKMLMAAQVILPLIGLVVGQLVGDREKIIARAFLIVLSILVPLQLLATWFQGTLILTHYLYAFSIYSHFQYVTLIFVCAFAYSVISLWEEFKIWLCVLAVMMVAYVTASLSFLTIFAYLSFLVIFVFSRLWAHRGNVKLVLGALAVVGVMGIGGVAYYDGMAGQRPSVEGQEGLFNGKFRTLAEGKIPSNVQERLNDWQFFGSEILESKKTLLVGHPQPMPRQIKSSPHNWYVDVAYTFGLVGLLPTLLMIAFTTYLCWTQRKTLPVQIWWLAGIVFYLVIVDSNFKVTLRQPYPGIFSYFMWGLLLSALLPAAVRKPSD